MVNAGLLRDATIGPALRMRALDRAARPAYIHRHERALTPDQIAWLRDKVADGQFSSLEEAAAAAISDAMASEVDDLSWAKPLADAARASVERGEFLNHDQFKQFIADERRKPG